MSSREMRLIREAIDKLALDLSGLVVITEAAGGNYACTPLICAAAGADGVVAVTRDSKYASAAEVKALTSAAAGAMGLAGRIQVLSGIVDEVWRSADIVTNTGFVRPIDGSVVQKLKPTAAVPIMFETWEFRDEDLDLGACWKRGISVLGTNEEHGAIRIMDYLGMLVAKKLFEHGIEIVGSRLVVFGSGKFFFRVCDALTAMRALVLRWLADFDEGGGPASAGRLAALGGADAVIIADEPNSTRSTIGAGGLIAASDLADHCPDALVVQLAGAVSRDDLAAAGIRCAPESPPAPGHMGWSLSELGPKPVIDLHAAGLKVGELLARARLSGLSPADAAFEALRNPVCQDFGPEQKRRYGCPF